MRDSADNDVLPVHISVQGLVYEAGGIRLLEIERADFRGNEPVVILGPNGAGKSLLLRLLHGLIKPTSGQILINGKENEPVARRKQSMVFQAPVLLRRSVAANISYALKVHGVPAAQRRKRTRDLLNQSNLSEHANQSARSLSGGEQQKLALIRALASEPEILFLDEPTSSLDPSASIAIEDLIKQASRAGTKIILVTHDLALAQRISGDILFIHHGQVNAQTKSNDFFDTPPSPEARAFLASKLLM